MYLAPHHFQAQARYAEAQIAHLPALLTPFAWGFHGVAVDQDALANGTLALLYASGRFPDGTPFRVHGPEDAPTPLSLAEHFSAVRDAQVAYLVIPPWRPDGRNVDDAAPGDASRRTRVDEVAEAEPRWTAVTRLVTDEVVGLERVPVRVAVPRLRLALDDALPPDAVALPVARLRRDGAGHLRVDEAFVPPCLRIGASPRLLAFVDALLAMLAAKGASLAATMAPPAPGGAAPGAAAYAGNELASRWLLHAVRSTEAPLRHLRAVEDVHPERLWTECARLAGALCTFSLGTQAADLPRYAHDDLTGAFDALERHLRTHLDVVVAPHTLVVPFAPGAQALLGGTLHVAPLADRRAVAPAARWYLALHPAPTAAPGFAAQATQLVPQLVKVCASRFVAELVRRAYPGLALAHLPAPPAALAPRPGALYFELAREGPCATAIGEAGEVGAYVPDALVGGRLELVVLLPG